MEVLVGPIEFIASLVLVLILGPLLGGVYGVALALILVDRFGWFLYFSNATEATYWDQAFFLVSVFVGLVILFDKLQDPAKHIRSNVEAFLLHDWRRSRREERERARSLSAGS